MTGSREKMCAKTGKGGETGCEFKRQGAALYATEGQAEPQDGGGEVARDLRGDADSKYRQLSGCLVCSISNALLSGIKVPHRFARRWSWKSLFSSGKKGWRFQARKAADWRMEESA